MHPRPPTPPPPPAACQRLGGRNVSSARGAVPAGVRCAARPARQPPPGARAQAAGAAREASARGRSAAAHAPGVPARADEDARAARALTPSRPPPHTTATPPFRLTRHRRPRPGAAHLPFRDRDGRYISANHCRKRLVKPPHRTVCVQPRMERSMRRIRKLASGQVSRGREHVRSITCAGFSFLSTGGKKSSNDSAPGIFPRMCASVLAPLSRH
ncbi:hypothetical protein PVAP13_4NG125119 [Panicum virgatum]|uniref:Uncharacterized protein n=1 Tax=Panicum virgatum TaxID=38727 RepID=A0A8T0T1E3_PANVG|nr:hypothetical protein PVAP13_4NG125119 [Panicum virgatum]